MGLEGVELLLALEETFGVTITDAEAEAAVTPALITELIFSKLHTSDQKVCVSQRGFYLLRKGLAHTMGVSRRSVTLNQDIRAFSSTPTESRVWADLMSAVQARSWPPLARPPWLTACLSLLLLASF